MNLQRPEEIEKESFPDEDSFADYLREVYYEDVDICGMKMDPVQILREMDPIAFRCAMNDAQEYTTVYGCPVCGEEYADEDDALWCCQDEEE